MLADEDCRELLERMPEISDPRVQKPFKIRRQEDIEEAFSALTPVGKTPFYFYKVSTGGPRAYFDAPPMQVFVAVNRQDGTIYDLFNEKKERKQFNTVAGLSRLVIDSPDRAVSLAELYEMFTQNIGFTFARDGDQLLDELSSYYDPKGLHPSEARKQALAILRGGEQLGENQLIDKYRLRAVKGVKSYTVSFYTISLGDSEPRLERISFDIHEDGTVSDLTDSTVALLGNSPWCTPSVLNRC